MSLIKIFPAFSPETEKNIQADKVGEIFGLNIYFRDAKEGKDFYLEIPMSAGSLFERACSVYNEPYNLNEELEKAKIKIAAQYSGAQEIKDRQFNFYVTLYGQMSNGELARERHFLVSYVKYKIIFGDLAQSQEDFYKVLAVLKEKQLAKNAAEKAERDEKNRIEEEKRREAEWARIDKIKQRIINDESIDGEDLVSFCKNYGIDIHIRTQGTIKQKVSEINSGQYRVQRGTLFKIPPTHYYKLLQDMIKEEGKPEEPISPEMEKLFGK